jgi:hypothetical protein
MSEMDGDQEQYDHHNRVKNDRAQRVDTADPTTAQALDIKLLEETDPGADKKGIYGADRP